MWLLGTGTICGNGDHLKENGNTAGLACEENGINLEGKAGTIRLWGNVNEKVRNLVSSCREKKKSVNEGF